MDSNETKIKDLKNLRNAMWIKDNVFKQKMKG